MVVQSVRCPTATATAPHLLGCKMTSVMRASESGLKGQAFTATCHAVCMAVICKIVKAYAGMMPVIPKAWIVPAHVALAVIAPKPHKVNAGLRMEFFMGHTRCVKQTHAGAVMDGQWTVMGIVSLSIMQQVAGVQTVKQWISEMASSRLISIVLNSRVAHQTA